MYEENSAIFIFWVIATIFQSFFVFLFAVAAVAMLCGYAESNGKGCNIIGVLGIILGVVGSFKSGMVLPDYDILTSIVTPIFGQDFLSPLFIVEVVTNSMFIISNAFLAG